MFVPQWYDDGVTAISAKHFLPFVVDRYKPQSAIDVGCGNGVWLKELERLGVSDLHGVDGPHSGYDRSRFTAADFERAFPEVKKRYDLCLCLETAEHLTESRGEPLIDYLCALAPTIVFSAAIAGQGGHGHTTCKFQSYWVEKFHRRGYRALEWLRRAVWNDPLIEVWYRQNCIAFEYYPDNPNSDFQDVVHPDFYRGRVGGI